MTRWLAVAITLALAVGCGGGSGGDETSPPGAVAASADEMRARNARSFEVMWMTSMIDHHAMAVEMGEACVDRAQHTELRDPEDGLCPDVIRVQTSEIEPMKGWLQDWYGVTYAAGMGAMMMMHGGRDLSGLSGAAFDLAFLQDMIPHHQQAVHMSVACVRRATHDELANLCEGIIESQSREIASMQEWLCDWFDICGSVHAGGGMGGPGGMMGGGMAGGGHH